MTPNVGTTERVIRLLVGVILIALPLFGVLPLAGVWGWIALIAGAILVLTAAIRYCPLSQLFGINTCER
ncbi:DUF2892 domain-containing protein [Rhodobacteraceae bacterium CCMM004]|nr:DUF2892 domain-containing protein [Rhodobacteraceae bacterium CCMM004]